MSNFLETFYFLFPYLEDNYEIWYGTGDRYGGWTIGFLILVFVVLGINLMYYLVGRSTARFAKMKGWLGFCGISALLVFLVSALVINYNVFDGIAPIWEAPADVWIFSLINSLVYTPVVFAVYSLGTRYLSKHARYVPYKF